MAWTRQTIGFVVGPAWFLASLFMESGALEPAAWRVAGLTLWMATWWITECIPLGATGLLPLVVIPVMGAGSEREAAAPYASPVVFLFLGGFLLAAAVQHWRLHERIAFWTAGLVGMRPPRIVAGFMAATALLSMWMSNTAAVILMIPMGMCVVRAFPDAHPDRDAFGKWLVLGIAYAASIGGLGTLIGSPPNAFLAAYARDHMGVSIRFGTWMLTMLPFVLLGLVAAWALLGRLHRVAGTEIEGAANLIAEQRKALGKLRPAEMRVALVFLTVALLWVVSPAIASHIPWPGDAAIALAGALALFALPSGQGRPLLRWEEAQAIPWGVLLLFGGGLSIAAAMERTGLAGFLGAAVATAAGGHVLGLVAGAALLSLLLTEFMSNTAAIAVLLPILSSVAIASSIEPMLLLIPATLAASCSFMMPAGTPPNAIAISTGHVAVRSMVRTGAWMNGLFLLLIVGYVFALERLGAW